MDFGLWLSFTKILLGFELMWLEIVWICVDFGWILLDFGLDLVLSLAFTMFFAHSSLSLGMTRIVSSYNSYNEGSGPS